MMEERLTALETKLRHLMTIPAIAEIVAKHKAETAEAHKKAVAEQEAAKETEKEPDNCRPPPGLGPFCHVPMPMKSMNS